MEHTTDTEREAALARLRAADLTAQIARATAVFDVLDAEHLSMTSADQYDWAFATWMRFVDFDAPIPVADFAAVLMRAARFLRDHTVVDFVSAQWPETDVDHQFDDGRRFRWRPDHDLLTLTYPMTDHFMDRILGGTPRLFRTA